MKRLFFVLLVGTLITACSPDQMEDTADSMMDHSHDTEVAMDHDHSPSEMDENRLNESPRHHEWVEVTYGDRTVYTWVVYPERSTAAPAVLVIHENRGLNDWARSFADQVAEAGYIAVAPDLLSGFSAEFDRTSDFADDDAARDALYELDQDQVQADLAAVADYAKSIEASNGKLATAGFCWGGARSFEFATQSDAADLITVFYGTSPEDASVYQGISAPVYGFYGGDDERVNSTIDRAEMAMEDLNKPYDIEIYDGAGHAFMRSGEAEDAEPANATARDQAWERLQEILQQLEEPLASTDENASSGQ